MLRFGAAEGPVVVVAPALFEEANRTRAFTVAVLRALAARGIAGVLPELPGQGESLLPTEVVDLATLRAAFAAAMTQAAGARPALVMSIRSGALVEDAARGVTGRWRLAPVLAGADLLRELARTRQMATGAPTLPDLLAVAEPVEIAGNLVSTALLHQLAGALLHAPARVARLDGDGREADLRLGGVPWWRQSEPSTDRLLVRAVSADIAHWAATCAG